MLPEHKLLLQFLLLCDEHADRITITRVDTPTSEKNRVVVSIDMWKGYVEYHKRRPICIRLWNLMERYSKIKADNRGIWHSRYHAPEDIVEILNEKGEYSRFVWYQVPQTEWVFYEIHQRSIREFLFDAVKMSKDVKEYVKRYQLWQTQYNIESALGAFDAC